MKIYKIESGIRIPAVVLRNGGDTPVSAVAATLARLEKSQSFLVKDALQALKAAKVLNDFARREKKRDGGRQFTSRRIKDGLRIWRVK